jgi:hypothetical protein
MAPLLAGTAAIALRRKPAVIAARAKRNRDTKRFDRAYVAITFCEGLYLCRAADRFLGAREPGPVNAWGDPGR